MALFLALFACTNATVTLGDETGTNSDDTSEPSDTSDTGDTNDTDTGDEPEPDHPARGTYNGFLGWGTEGWDICSMDASIRVNKVGGLKFDEPCPYTTQSGQLVELEVSIEGTVDEETGEFDAVIRWQSWERDGWDWVVSDFEAPLVGRVENNEMLFGEFIGIADYGNYESEMFGFVEANR